MSAPLCLFTLKRKTKKRKIHLFLLKSPNWLISLTTRDFWAGATHVAKSERNETQENS